MTINTAEIEARLAKATPGPWAAIGSPQGDYTIYLVNAQPHPAMRGFTKGIGELATEDDAVFIAHAPTDIAALLAALKVETARAEAMERMWEIALDEARKANDAISTRLHQETNALKALGNAFEIERARTDRLTAQLTAANEKLAAANELVRTLGDPLLEICDHLEDESDRVYLGSTNHADTLKGVQQSYWLWWLQEEIDAGRCNPDTNTGDGNGR